MNKIIKFEIFIFCLITICSLTSCFFKEKKYTVTFKDWDGTLLKEEKIEKGESATPPLNINRDGYIFIGWSEDYTNIEKDLVVVAQYKEEVKYKVQFFNDDGTLLKEEYILEGEKIEDFKPKSKEGYEFKGWYVGNIKWNFSGNVVTKDLILEAYWEIETYTIEFDTNGGEEIKKITFDKERGLPELPKPNRRGYKFLGWYEENELVTKLEYKNYNLVALWEEGIDTNIPVTIEYWHANGTALTIVLEQIKDSFEEKYPNYTVELTSFGDYTTLRDIITGAIAGGVTPTAAQTYPDHVALYLQGKSLVNLDTYINDPEYGMSAEEQAQFVEGFWAEGTIYDEAGTRYAMPFNKSTEIMYYNADIFAKYKWDVPQTWDDVIKICEAWKSTTEYKNAVSRYGINYVYGLGYDSEANLFITLTEQYGAEFTSFDENGKGRVNAFGDVESDMLKSKSAMSWLLSEVKKGNIGTPSSFCIDYCSDAFKNGQCIMTIGSSAGANYHDGNDSYINTFTTAVTAVPQKDLANGQVIQQGTNVSLFKGNSSEEELAGWLWLKHMVSYESALTWALNTSYMPIRIDVMNSFEYQNHVQGNIVLDDGTVVPGTQSLAAKAKQAAILQAHWFYTNIAFNGSSKARDKAETLVQLLLYGDNSVDKAYDYVYQSFK